MAKTFTAPFPQTPRTATAIVTGASNYDTDVPSNTALLLTAGTDGALITRVWGMPRATSSASVAYVWLSKDGGNTKRLIAAKMITAWSASGTSPQPVTLFDWSELTPLRLEASDKLYVGMSTALGSGFVFFAQQTDY